MTLRLALNDAAHALLPGQRLRLALSTAYWPTLWPSPEPVGLTILPGARLSLPLHPPGRDDAWPFEAAEGAAPTAGPDTHCGDCTIRVEPRSLPDGRTRVTYSDDYGGRVVDPHGLAVDSRGEQVMTVHPEDPLSARCETAWTHTLARGPWQVRTETRTTMSADATQFHLTAALQAWEGDAEVLQLTWSGTIPRDHV